MLTQIAVTARDLTLCYGDQIALRDVSLDLPQGGLIAVIGPNGSGKSTFLGGVAGLLKPNSGSITVAAEVAYVFQATQTPDRLPLTVREVVTMGRYRRSGLLGRIGQAGRDAIERAMKQVAVTDLADRQLHELSGGQRQRVLVAQGLAADARILLLDEPMIGLDMVSRDRMVDVLTAQRDEKRTVIFTTHDMAEAQLADVVVLLAGELVAVGAPGEVLTDDNLRRAYMGRVLSTSGGVQIDDAHHH